MYSIIIPLTKTATEIKRYDSLKSFNAAVNYYRARYSIMIPLGDKSFKFLN